MGCDIHMVLERKIGDEWVGMHNYNSPNSEAITLYDWTGENIESNQRRPWVSYRIMDRNYELFGELAGVRTEGSLGNEPRGLPEDMSQLTRVLANEWGQDGHSHSHLSLTEFVAAYAASEDETAKLVEHRLSPTEETSKWFYRIAKLVSGIEIYDQEYESFRICFWFDN